MSNLDTMTPAILMMAQSIYPNITIDSLTSALNIANDTEVDQPQRDPLLKIKDAAALLSLSRQHISKLAEVGELKRINVGIDKKLYRITLESIDAFLARRAS